MLTPRLGIHRWFRYDSCPLLSKGFEHEVFTRNLERIEEV